MGGEEELEKEPKNEEPRQTGGPGSQVKKVFQEDREINCARRQESSWINYGERASGLGDGDGNDDPARSNFGTFIGIKTRLKSIQVKKKNWRWSTWTTLSRNFAVKGRKGAITEGEMGR